MTWWRGLWASTVRALRPGPRPLAVAAAVRAVVAAGVIAGCGVVVGDFAVVAVAYLGAACAVAFVGSGSYRTRAVGLGAQAAGAALGIIVGAAGPHSAVGLVAVAAACGAVSGAVGVLGPAAPGFGMMLAIGAAFGQFGGSTLPPWEQAGWYCAGTAVVAAAALLPWVRRTGVLERSAAAAVLSAAADLCAVIGTDAARPARVRLAAASETARRTGPQPLAELVAFAAASLYADGEPVPPEAVTAIRAAAVAVGEGRAGTTGYTPPDDASPALRALADALGAPPATPTRLPPTGWGDVLRAVGTPEALLNAARIASCMAVATALTVALHEPPHSFWLPLTVAVIVRPEYGSVFVRTVNRVCGTVLGAAVTAVVLSAHPTTWVVAVAAAVALGFAVLVAPKLYGLNVIGVTASALLSASLTGVDEVLPGLRMLDTFAGAAVAVVVGYLAWPGARRSRVATQVAAARRAAMSYLDEAVKASDERRGWRHRRDEAYRSAHLARAVAEAAMAEPPPVGEFASTAVPLAVELEEIVDGITAVAAARDVASVDQERVRQLRDRLAVLGER